MSMRTVRVSATDIRKVWADKELTLKEAATMLGLSVDTLQARAAMMRLPARKEGRREVIRPRQEALFCEMWKAGISARQIGQAFGCSYFAVVNTAARLKLDPRGAGYRPATTVTGFCQAKLGAAMMEKAKAENAIRKVVFA